MLKAYISVYSKPLFQCFFFFYFPNILDVWLPCKSINVLLLRASGPGSSWPSTRAHPWITACISCNSTCSVWKKVFLLLLWWRECNTGHKQISFVHCEPHTAVQLHISLRRPGANRQLAGQDRHCAATVGLAVVTLLDLCFDSESQTVSMKSFFLCDPLVC